MKPTVFISSTVRDLKHIRDAVRSTVDGLGYYPIMSDYNDIGYMEGGSAVEACYGDVSQCQMVVLIIGKRYGWDPEKEGSSITEREWEAAFNNVQHIITLVDREVLNYLQVYEENDRKMPLRFPEMDYPKGTFAFINRIKASPSKNGIIAYSNADDVKSALTKQFASLFYNALVDKTPKTATAINDVLFEIKALAAKVGRIGNEKDNSVGGLNRYLTAMRLLMRSRNDSFSSFVYAMAGEPEIAASAIVNAKNIDEFISNLKFKMDFKELRQIWNPGMQIHGDVKTTSAFVPEDRLTELAAPIGAFEAYVIYRDGRISMTKGAYAYFSRRFGALISDVQQDDK